MGRQRPSRDIANNLHEPVSRKKQKSEQRYT